MTDGRHFTCADDNLLLREALAAEIWRAERVMEAWEALARRLAGSPAFPPRKDGRALRTRFRLLLRKFRESALESMRHAGSREELDEREDLLHEIDVEIREVDAARGKRSDEDAVVTAEDETGEAVSTSFNDNGGRETSERASKRQRQEEETVSSSLTMVVDRAVALLERVLTQQQQQLAYQHEQIEKQLAMQQQQMQMIMTLVEKVTRG